MKKTKPRVSIPLLPNYKVKGYDIAEKIKEYKKLIEVK